MPRPRKPTKLLELTGAVKKNPQRFRDRASEPQGHAEIGPPPREFLNEFSPTAVRHLELWHAFIAEAPPGCITGSDRTRLKNACILQAQIDRGNATVSMHAMMDRYLSGFGMSGAGRAQRGVKEKKEAVTAEGEWARFARDRQESRLN